MEETLARTIEDLRLMKPVSRNPLHLFPLRSMKRTREGLFLLLEDGLEVGTLRVEELSEEGSVPELRVINEGTLPVLILEGDELSGAKQNRVVNSSVLIAAESNLTLPVSCVERGRWSYRSRAFSPAPGGPHLALRRLKSRSVHDSLRLARGHKSDQGAVWQEVDRKARLHESSSPTHSLQDARSHLSTELDPFEDLAEELPQDTRGIAVALGGRLLLLEVLAGPRSFAGAARKLLSGYAFEAVGAREAGEVPDATAVRRFIRVVASAGCKEYPTVGSGRDLRFQAEGISGYALIGEKGVLHAAAFAE